MNDKLAGALDNNKLLEIIKRCSYDAFFITDNLGVICFVSDSYERVTGYNPHNLIEKHYTQLKKSGVLDITLVEKVLENHKPTSMMLEYNNEKEALVTAIPVFDKTNNFIAVIGNIRDMTELNKLEHKLAKITKQAQRVNEELTDMRVFQDYGNEYVFRSVQMRNLASLAVRIAKFDTTILITGESGVGKDVYAHLIQKLNNKDGYKPFMKISCGAIPETLLESELFGYEDGAFTGAKKGGKQGIFEVAQDGIVFLDEIGEMPLSLQVKLLNVLQDREFMRVGGTKPIKMKARIIAATNKNLEEAVKNKTFREDLYFRLNVINVCIPPLRERKDDIVPLTMMFLNKLNKKYNLNKTFDSEVLSVFENYSWPGNVRELSNIVERLIVLSPYEIINENILPIAMNSSLDELDIHNINENMGLNEYLEKVEHIRIIKAINNNETLYEAAKELKIDNSTLTRKIQKYHIPKKNQHKYIHTENLNVKL